MRAEIRRFRFEVNALGTNAGAPKSNCAMKHALLLLAPLCLAPSAFAQTRDAQTRNAQNQTQTPNQTELPLRQVVLFSSGVGYFSRAGEISGDAAVDLTVRAPQVSDLLKSLVLFDEKGSVAPVSYSIADTIGNRATETDLNIPANATPGQILMTFRGAQVVLTRDNGGKIAGRIASVSTRQVPSDKGAVTVEVVNLLTPTGLVSVDLSQIASFDFPDAALGAKFTASLEKSAGLLTSRLDDGARRVTLHFNGKGKRMARAGYLLEMPTWKTSYRLVLDDNKKPFLQGWAIVENPTDADWKDVQLSLVAGRPISFIQNLATPIYVTRPVVQSEIPNASFTPQTFGDSLGTPDDVARVAAIEGQNGVFVNGGGFGGGGGGFGGNSLELRDGPRGPMGAPDAAPVAARDEMAQIANISAIAAQASAADAGELFVYALDQKLNLPRGEAAMVPIVSQTIGGDAVSIVNNPGNTGTQIVQNGFRLKNDSGLRLSGGPITVYQSGIYGGDARLNGLSPQDSKLIAYGIDLDLVAKREDDDSHSQLLQIIAANGVLVRRYQGYLTQTYALKNKAVKAKTVLIQQPDNEPWKLVDAKQRDEKSTEGDRFRVELKAGEARRYEIKWERTYDQTIAIGDFDFANLDIYLRDSQIAPALKAKLETVAAARARVQLLAGQIKSQGDALKAIADDQSRLRENMKVLDKDSKLYQTYAAKLGAQEDRIVAIDAEIDRLQAAQKVAQSALDAAVAAI